MKNNNWTEEIVERIVELYENHTYNEIATIIKKEYKIDKTPNAIRKAFKRYHIDKRNIYYKDEEVELYNPKILIFDIETAPMLGYVWGMWDQNVGLNQIHTDWYVLSWSAKWLGAPENEVMYQDQRNRKNIENDKTLLKGIWNLLNEADIVITQNGKKFDQKKLNARFILNGFKPPNSYRHIDTLVLARKHFAFTSNKLEYMTDKLCKKYKKSKHSKFVGFELWKQCLAGNNEAWKEMERYNKLDVLSLEELYTVLMPWDGTINHNVYHDSEKNVCRCGSTNFTKNGFMYTNTLKYQRYQCKKCGAEYRGATSLSGTEKKKKMFRVINGD